MFNKKNEFPPKNNQNCTKKSKSKKCCAWCETKNTPQWRSGPSQTNLCNKCGLRYFKMKNETNMGRKMENENKIENDVSKQYQSFESNGWRLLPKPIIRHYSSGQSQDNIVTHASENINYLTTRGCD